MKLKHQTKIYAILTLVCISMIMFLSFYFSDSSRTNGLSPDKLIEQNLNLSLDNMLMFLAFATPWLLLIVYGIINLVLFIISSLKSEPIFDQFEKPRALPLSTKKIFKLLFFISYFYLLMLLISMITISSFSLGLDHKLKVLLTSNFITQIFVIFCILRFIPNKSLNIKFSTKSFGLTLRFYSAVLIILNIATLILFLISQKLGFKPTGQAAIYLLLNLKDPWLLLFFGFQIVVLAPLSEELLFRGFIYPSIRNKANIMLSAIITSIIFASLHGNLFGFFIIFILSIALCYIYEKTQNLTLAVLFHAMHNSLVFLTILLFKNFIT